MTCWGMRHYKITLSKTVVAWARGQRVCVRGSRKDGRQVRGNNRSPPDRTVANVVNTNLTMLRWYPVASCRVKDKYINKKINTRGKKSCNTNTVQHSTLYVIVPKYRYGILWYMCEEWLKPYLNISKAIWITQQIIKVHTRKMEHI